MKTIVFLLSVFLTVNVSFAQSHTEFIKIVGNSKSTIQSNGYIVEVQLLEVERNEYKKTQERTLEEIKKDLDIELKTIGLSIKNLEEIFPPQQNYSKQKQERFKIKVKTEEEASALYKFQVSGYKPTGLKYTYDENAKVDDEKMAADAITDARRKAASLAKEVGRKVGGVLSIEDRSFSNIGIPSSSNESHTFKYTVTITFELID